MTTWPDAIVRGSKVAGMAVESPWLLKGYGWLLVDVVQTATDPEQAWVSPVPSSGWPMCEAHDRPCTTIVRATSSGRMLDGTVTCKRASPPLTWSGADETTDTSSRPFATGGEACADGPTRSAAPIAGTRTVTTRLNLMPSPSPGEPASRSS
jgi:hypothetical protein